MRHEVSMLTAIFVIRHASNTKCVMTVVHYYAIAARTMQIDVPYLDASSRVPAIFMLPKVSLPNVCAPLNGALSRVRLMHSPPIPNPYLSIEQCMNNILTFSISITPSATKHSACIPQTPFPKSCSVYRRLILLHFIAFIIRISLVISFLLTYWRFKSRSLRYRTRTANPITVPLHWSRPILGRPFGL
jgi:hypothetical protein